MDIVLSIIGVLLAWRFFACLGLAAAAGFVVGHLYGPVAGFALLFLGIGFGLIWQSRWLSGIPLFASVPSPPISRPVTFLGLSFIGALWGGFAAEFLGSAISAALTLVAVVALGGGWYAVVLKRHIRLRDLAFFAFSLLSGLGAIYALAMLRA